MGQLALVTGADGFIGSHLVEYLVEKGYRVRALVLYNSFNNWGWLEQSAVKKQIEIVSGDIRDPFLCENIMEGVDVVFHLAALIAIPYSYLAPASYVDTNVTGTVNICKAALKHKVKRLIHTSTSEVYGSALYVPIDEKHPLQPQSPYSASKIAGDSMALSFYNSFDLSLTIARPFNTYGPRQSARAVIPTIISQIAAGKKEINLGDVTTTRDFNYVLDTCEGFYLLANSDKTIGKTVNIGSNFEISIENTFNEIKDIMKSDAKIKIENERLRPVKSEVVRLWCDNSLIKDLTGFVPKYSIRKGLEETVAWFTSKENLMKYKTDIYNV